MKLTRAKFESLVDDLVQKTVETLTLEEKTILKLRYALDSIFSFTDLPVRALMLLGAIGTSAAVVRRCAGCSTWRRCRRCGTTRP